MLPALPPSALSLSRKLKLPVPLGTNSLKPTLPRLSLRWGSRGPASRGFKKERSPKERSRSFPGALQGVLLELMTADTRSGTDTANGSEMVRALRWCRGDDSSGKRLPGNDGLEEPLWAEPEYSIRRFFGDVGWQAPRSSPLNTFSCSGRALCSGEDEEEEEEGRDEDEVFGTPRPFKPGLPPMTPLAFRRSNSHFGSCSRGS